MILGMMNQHLSHVSCLCDDENIAIIQEIQL